MEYESIEDVPFDEELINALKQTNASNLFIDVVKVAPEDVGIERNFARDEIRKYCMWEGEVSPEAIESNHHLGGGYFKTLWEGDVNLCFSRADHTNQKILEHLGYLVPA